MVVLHKLRNWVNSYRIRAYTSYIRRAICDCEPQGKYNTWALMVGLRSSVRVRIAVPSF